MSNTLMRDTFDHHVWATLCLIDECLKLDDQQLNATEIGTYGSILDTMRHLVGGDVYYLNMLMSDRVSNIDELSMNLSELRKVMVEMSDHWSWLADQELNYDEVVVDSDGDGYSRDASLSIRLAQALHHGTDHRSQICTNLTTLGVTPPDIDVWAFGIQSGRVRDVAPTATTID